MEKEDTRRKTYLTTLGVIMALTIELIEQSDFPTRFSIPLLPIIIIRILHTVAFWSAIASIVSVLLALMCSIHFDTVINISIPTAYFVVSTTAYILYIFVEVAADARRHNPSDGAGHWSGQSAAWLSTK